MIFETPFLAVALLGLPLLWWLFRLRPPAPQKIAFPALTLIKPAPEQQVKTSPPWWLTALRMIIAALIILGCAGPIYKPLPVTETGGYTLLIIDNGWSAASQWSAIKTAALEVVHEQSTANNKIYVAFTAQPFAPIEALTPSLARAAIERLTPQPWSPNRHALAAQLPKNINRTVWVSDGIDDGGSAMLTAAVQQQGPLRVVLPAKAAPLIIKNAHINAEGFQVTLERPANLPAQNASVSVIADDGSVVSHLDIPIPSNAPIASGTLILPPGTRSAVSRIAIDGENSAAAVYLLGSNAKRNYVGIVSAETASDNQPFKAMDYYLKRALESHADIKTGTLGSILNAGVNILMLADVGQFSTDDSQRLAHWIDQGGMTIMFAGPRLAEQGSPFSPVKLRAASRTLGGAMSWQKPLNFSEWPAASPFAGLKIANDVTVREQVLADPTADLSGHVWATLSDGTPIVTASKRGRGLVVLVHTTANAAWSTLALSGLFEDMMVQLLSLAQTTSTAMDTSTVKEVKFTLDQALLYDGMLAQSTGLNVSLPVDVFATLKPGPQNPPGFYTAGTNIKVLNLGDTLNVPKPIIWPGSVAIGKSQTVSVALMPWLLSCAVILLLLDWIVVLFLQGQIKRIVHIIAIAASAVGITQAKAEPAGALEVRLAYVTSGISTSAASGLAALGDALKARTATDVGAPVPVNPERANLGLYALVYWPVALNAAPLSPEAIRHVQRYLETGGLIIFDTSGQNALALRQLLQPLDLPRLEQLSQAHVLAHSFYLLGRVPGGFDFASQWVESGTLGANGRTSGVVLSLNGGWADAWASGNEAALRYGINLVIYTLSGTYKADQVHAASLLERMGKARDTR